MSSWLTIPCSAGTARSSNGHSLVVDALHQFVRVGRLVIIGGNERVTQEVPPFGAVSDGGLRGYNAIGCKCAGMSRDTIQSIRQVYRAFHRHRLNKPLIQDILANVENTPEVLEFVEFVRVAKRGLVSSVRGRRLDTDANTDE